MYQCAGICYSRRNQTGMACTIRLSEPLLKLRPRKDLIETLLHEMIHAWNFIRGVREENGGHGQNFLGKMHEINRAAGTNISVYHSFHDEVEVYKNHWWRCSGVCKERKPYYGFVKRTSNRAPGKNDNWWKHHEQTCGGEFIKVKEPEKKRKGKENTKKDGSAPKSVKAPPKKTSPGVDIRKFFKPDKDDGTSTIPVPLPTTGFVKDEDKPTLPKIGGFTLGGSSNGRSRLLDLFIDKTKKTERKPVLETKAVKKRKLSGEGAAAVSAVIVIDDDFVAPTSNRKSFHTGVRKEFDDDDEIILIDDEFDDDFPTTAPTQSPEAPLNPKDICQCPCCNVSIHAEKINEHLDQCLGLL